VARGVNKVILVGNLGSAPETRHTPSGNPITSFSIATSESWLDKQTGQRQERTEWHRIVCFSKLAEICQQYLHKGSQVYIEGSLRTNKWQDKNGVERSTTEIIATDIQMLGSRNSNDGGSSNNSYNNGGYQPSYNNKSNFSPPNNSNNNNPKPNDTFDDDIPF